MNTLEKRKQTIRSPLLWMLAWAWSVCCPAATFDVLAPPPVPVENSTSTTAPFVIMRSGWTSMRYQQVYSGSLFTNVPPEYVYITRFGYNYYPEPGNHCPPDFSDWGMTLQINLSTTQSPVGGLSTNFSENVGSNDTIVLGPTQIVFPVETSRLFFDRPFRYDPTQGNLLLDVRVWDATGTLVVDRSCFDATGYNLSCMCLWAVDSPTNVSRVWATNVDGAVATDGDTTGLLSVFQFTPVPSLQAEFHPLWAGTLSNVIIMRWPAQPSTFVLQRKDDLGANSPWQAVTNEIFGTPENTDRTIELPA